MDDLDNRPTVEVLPRQLTEACKSLRRSHCDLLPEGWGKAVGTTCTPSS